MDGRNTSYILHYKEPSAHPAPLTSPDSCLWATPHIWRPTHQQGGLSQAQDIWAGNLGSQVPGVVWSQGWDEDGGEGRGFLSHPPLDSCPLRGEPGQSQLPKSQAQGSPPTAHSQV